MVNITGIPIEITGPTTIEGLPAESTPLSIIGNSSQSAHYLDITQSGESTGNILSVDASGNFKNSGNVNVGGSIYQGSSLLVPTGSIFPYCVATAPTGYLLCDGSAISRTTYSILFGIVSTIFGSGNGTTTFNVPNLQGKFIMGHDSSTYSFNSSGGSASTTLTTTQLPTHSHTITIDETAHTHTASDSGHSHTYMDTIWSENHAGGETNNQAGSTDGTDYDNSSYYKSPNPTTQSSSANITVESAKTNLTASASNSGTGSSFSILNPYLALSYIIKY